MTFSLRHLLAALVLHGLLVALLAGGVQCTRKPTRPPVIQAVLLDPDRKTAQARQQEQKKRIEEQKRADQKRKLEEQARQKEKQDQQRKQAEAQQRQREEAARKQQAAADAQKKKAEDARKQKELADKKKAEDLARKKQEQEEARERQSEAQRELQNKALMEEQMRREDLDREAARREAAIAATERDKAVALWSEAVKRDVTRAWNRPPGAANFVCMVRIQQLPDGTVTNAKIIQNCGNPQLNSSVEEAVLRASPLPTISDRAYFMKEFSFEFTP